MPPRDRNQYSPMNWIMMKKNPKASWKMNGSPCTIRTGSWNSAVAAGSPKSCAITRSRIRRKKRSFTTRATRKRVQSSILDVRRS
jgi:hypothetical protein